MIYSTDAAPYAELQQTACQRHRHKPQLGRNRYIAMHYAACGHGYGQSQSYSPEIERQLLILRQSAAQGRPESTQSHGACQRHEQKRKYLAKYQQCRTDKRQLRIRMNKRYHSRYKHGISQVYQYGVGGDVAYVAAKFLGDYSPGGSGRAYKTQHGALKHHPQCAVRQHYQHAADYCKEATLYQQQPQMPSAQAQMARVNLAESKKEHGEDKHRLYHRHCPVCCRMSRKRQRKGCKHKVTGHACQDGYD